MAKNENSTCASNLIVWFLASRTIPSSLNNVRVAFEWLPLGLKRVEAYCLKRRFAPPRVSLESKKIVVSMSAMHELGEDEGK